MSRCDSCKYPYDIRKWPCEDCLQGDRYEPKPRTNADRIRAMTDDELAKKMSGLESFALTCGGGWPPEKWLDWLKEEGE